jgi:hypothetical protein
VEHSNKLVLALVVGFGMTVGTRVPAQQPQRDTAVLSEAATAAMPMEPKALDILKAACKVRSEDDDIYRHERLRDGGDKWTALALRDSK